jgi:hypothetical protein
MVSGLISVSLLLLLALGVVALIFAGKDHDSSSVEDVRKDDD